MLFNHTGCILELSHNKMTNKIIEEQTEEKWVGD
jgi:hypothetical protein